MRRRMSRSLIVAFTTLVGALVGIGGGAALTGDAPRYESTATVAIVPASGLPEDLSADFWQVLSEGQVVRTAASIYGNGQWAADAAESLGVEVTDLELSASALVDTTLVQVSLRSTSAELSDDGLRMVLESGSVAAAEILDPFVISEASVESAVMTGPAETLQLLGAVVVSGALIGAGVGLLLSGTRQRKSVEQPPASPSGGRGDIEDHVANRNDDSVETLTGGQSAGGPPGEVTSAP